MKTEEVDLIGWIKQTLLFHVQKKVIEENRTPTKHISP